MANIFTAYKYAFVPVSACTYMCLPQSLSTFTLTRGL